MFITVDNKFIAPNKELIPAKCKDTIKMSTDAPLWDTIPARGGYNVHPVPAPCSIHILAMNNTKEGANSHQETLFKRGYDISGAPL